jgi:UPF0716 family protein affecting phage T7 exclusion
VLEVVVFSLVIGCPLVGALVRRWFVVALPLVAWPLFYWSLNEDWLLDSDGWQRAALSLMLPGFVTTALAVAAGRSLKPPPKTHETRFAKSLE